MTYRVSGGGKPPGLHASPESAVCDGLRRMEVEATIDGREVRQWVEGCWTSSDAISYLLGRLTDGDGLFGVRIEASGRSLPVWRFRTIADRVRELRKQGKIRRKRRGHGTAEG